MASIDYMIANKLEISDLVKLAGKAGLITQSTIGNGDTQTFICPTCQRKQMIKAFDSDELWEACLCGRRRCYPRHGRAGVKVVNSNHIQSRKS